MLIEPTCTPWGPGSVPGHPFARYSIDGYHVPVPGNDGGDLIRFHNEDLPGMDGLELETERHALLGALAYLRMPGVPDFAIPYPSDGSPAGFTRFTDWARRRIGAMEGLMRHARP